MDDGSITLLVALVILIAFSAFFSASETAFSSLNQIRLKSRAEEGDTSAARVLAMAEKYDKLLSSILIGNNIVNIAAASIGTVLFTKWLGEERGATASTIVLTIVVLIFGEVTPKTLAKEMPETIATAVSPVLNLLLTLFTPLTWLFSQWKKLLGHFVHSSESDTITEGELITMVSEAESDGELTDRESQLIRSAIEFDDVEVEEILTPRVDVVAVEDNISLEQLAQTFAESGYSRLPVYHDTIDNIIGVVHEKDFYLARLKKTATLEDLIAPTLYTTGSTRVFVTNSTASPTTMFISGCIEYSRYSYPSRAQLMPVIRPAFCRCVTVMPSISYCCTSSNARSKNPAGYNICPCFAVRRLIRRPGTML